MKKRKPAREKGRKEEKEQKETEKLEEDP